MHLKQKFAGDVCRKNAAITSNRYDQFIFRWKVLIQPHTRSSKSETSASKHKNNAPRSLHHSSVHRSSIILCHSPFVLVPVDVRPEILSKDVDAHFGVVAELIFSQPVQLVEEGAHPHQPGVPRRERHGCQAPILTVVTHLSTQSTCLFTIYLSI